MQENKGQEMKNDNPMDGKSKHEIIEEHSFLVISFAKKHKGKGITYIDLINAGNTGLSKAVDTFWHKKRDFIKYASSCIDEQMRFAIEHNKKELNLSKTYDDLNRLSEVLRNFRERTSTKEDRVERFKNDCEGRKDFLVLDSANNKITTASAYNKMIKDGRNSSNVVFLLPTSKSNGNKKYDNNIVSFQKKDEENEN